MMSEMNLQKTKTNGATTSKAHFRMTPAADIYESENEFLVHIDVPGVASDTIDVQALGAELTVRAQQSPATVDTEAAITAFERVVQLPGEVDASTASARVENGVLEIRIQKSPSARRTKIPVRGVN
jgi:HSP20 family protein